MTLMFDFGFQTTGNFVSKQPAHLLDRHVSRLGEVSKDEQPQSSRRTNEQEPKSPAAISKPCGRRLEYGYRGQPVSCESSVESRI